MKRPSSPAPPGARILTGGQLSAVPEAADLLPLGLADTWGVEFDQRDADSLILKALAPALGLIGAAVLTWLVVYGVSRVNWSGLAGIIVLTFLAIIFMAFRNLKRSLLSFYQALTRQPLKAWLIFSPGRIAWLRKTVIGRRELALDHADITRLALVPFEPVKYRIKPRQEYHDPYERILQAPVWPGKQIPDAPGLRLLILYYRLDGDGPERSEQILFERGPGDLCLWAAGLIQQALAPREAPFDNLVPVRTDPHNLQSTLAKDPGDGPAAIGPDRPAEKP